MVSFSRAVRQSAPLLIGLAGASGSGKTLSALMLARGLANGDDSKIAFVDTENGRALLYAPPVDADPAERTFGFLHAALDPPFSPESYLSAIDAAIEAGAKVIIVDSWSHGWVGQGGLHDLHEAELDRLAGNDLNKRERQSLSAWKTPKSRNRKLVMRLIQARAHVILCLRAEDRLRLEIATDESGRKRTTITAAADLPLRERYVPVCERRLPYELTISLLLTPERPGVPIVLKAPDGMAPIFAKIASRQIDVDLGRALADWANGGAKQEARTASSDAIWWEGVALDPGQPVALDLPTDVGEDGVKFLAKTLKAVLTRSAPDVRDLWWEKNGHIIAAKSQKLADWVLGT